VHATLEDLAKAKSVAPSYVSRVLRITMLSPARAEDGGLRAPRNQLMPSVEADLEPLGQTS
jgi:hypothetical protein